MKARLFLALVVLLALLGAGYFLVKSPRFQVFGGLTNRVNTDEKVVALTFDDGPSPGDTQAVLAELKDLNTPATFFLVGKTLAEHPEEAKLIAQAGHQLGNHSYSHGRMVFTPLREVASEITRTNELIRQAGYTGDIRFRPPYGKKFLTLPFYLMRHGYQTVTWDVAPEYGQEETPEILTGRVLKQVKPGSIILLHPMNGRTQTQQALRPIVTGLKAQGYRFVTVNELIAEK